MEVAPQCAGSKRSPTGHSFPRRAPPLGGDDAYLETRLPSTVATVPVPDEPVDVEVGESDGGIVRLLVGPDVLLEIRFPAAVADSAESLLQPGMPLSLRFRYPAELGAMPRDELVREASVQLLSPLGRLFVDGGDRPLGPEFEPYYWGGRPTECVGANEEPGTADEYRFPADGEVVPLREPVRRAAAGREFLVFRVRVPGSGSTARAAMTAG